MSTCYTRLSDSMWLLSACCSEVKCPISINNCDFEKYTMEKNACLEKGEGVFHLKRQDNYFFQVQQQVFTVTNRKHCDFVLCAISPHREPQVVIERIYPDLEHWHTVVPKLKAFWRACILPEILGCWYTRKRTLPMNKPSGDGICFCRGLRDDTVITCSNPECPYTEFHPSCLASGLAMTPKTWYCPHCTRLLQFKQRGGRSSSAKQSAHVAVDHPALQSSQEVEDQTNDLLGGRLARLQFVPVQQQTNGYDCGIFAIAFATCLALGTNPSNATFDIQRMHSHLVTCLRATKMSTFPCF